MRRQVALGRLHGPRLHPLQVVLAARDETRRRRRRSAEQVEQQPGMAMKIADQMQVAIGAEVLEGTVEADDALVRLPKLVRHGEVVMYAGDGLHEAVVAMRQPDAIQLLEAADVGTAVSRDRHLAFRTSGTGHARSPEDLAFLHVRQRESMDVLEHPEATVDALVLGRDEFEQGLGEIRGDIRILQRRAERRRMRPPRNAALGRHAQAFLLDPAADRGPFGLKKGKPIALQGSVETVGHIDSEKEKTTAHRESRGIMAKIPGRRDFVKIRPTEPKQRHLKCRLRLIRVLSAWRVRCPLLGVANSDPGLDWVDCPLRPQQKSSKAANFCSNAHRYAHARRERSCKRYA